LRFWGKAGEILTELTEWEVRGILDRRSMRADEGRQGSRTKFLNFSKLTKLGRRRN
jgi:hypothetical protein